MKKINPLALVLALVAAAAVSVGGYAVLLMLGVSMSSAMLGAASGAICTVVFTYSALKGE